MSDTNEPVPGQSSGSSDSISSKSPVTTGFVGKPTVNSYQPIAATRENNPGADPKAVSKAVETVVKDLPSDQKPDSPILGEISDSSRASAPEPAPFDDPFHATEKNAAAVAEYRKAELDAPRTGQQPDKPEDLARYEAEKAVKEALRTKALDEQRTADTIMRQNAARQTSQQAAETTSMPAVEIPPAGGIGARLRSFWNMLTGSAKQPISEGESA